MPVRAFPYRRPPSDVVTAQPWRLVAEGDELPLPEALPYWDYHMDLRFRRSVELTASRVRTDSGLPDDAALTLSVTWTSTGSGLRAPAASVPVRGDDPVGIELDFRIEGSDLGGVLLLDTVLVLAERCRRNTSPTPWRAGSVLWRDQHRLRLQGDAPQFPMAVVDFADTPFLNDAGWHLQIGSDLHAAAMGSLLLLINERNSAVTEAFRNAVKPRPVDRAVLAAVRADVARVMTEHALRHEEFADGADFPEDSLGATLHSLFRRVFPGTTVEDARRRLNHSPNWFSSDLQAAVKIFKDL